MKNKIENYYEISKDLKKDFPKLTEFETLTLAIQIERNQILENSLGVSREDKYPSALQAIAISLGFDGTTSSDEIAKTLREIANKLEK